MCCRSSLSCFNLKEKSLHSLILCLQRAPTWFLHYPAQSNGGAPSGNYIRPCFHQPGQRAVGHARVEGPHFQDDMKSYVNEGVRVLVHGKSIVVEDELDKRWEEVTGEVIDEVIFFSKHTAASKNPALIVHPIGVPHLCQGDVPPQGGRPGWAALPNPRMGPWLRLLKNLAQAHNLVPEFEEFQGLAEECHNRIPCGAQH